MWHADADFLYTEIAAAFDDLLQGGDQRLRTVEAEALGAGVFDIQEFLETFRFHQLVEDRALAFARERDLLVAALDAFLNPAFLRSVGDVHELHTKRLAVGAAQDGDNFAHRRELEAEHLVEVNLPVEITFREPVGARIEFLFVLLRFESEWIELGMEMAADAVGADQHQRVNRITRCLHHIGGGKLDTFGLRGRRNLLADLLFGLGPLAVESRNQIAARPYRPVWLLPGRAAG